MPKKRHIPFRTSPDGEVVQFHCRKWARAKDVERWTSGQEPCLHCITESIRRPRPSAIRSLAARLWS